MVRIWVEDDAPVDPRIEAILKETFAEYELADAGPIVDVEIDGRVYKVEHVH